MIKKNFVLLLFPTSLKTVEGSTILYPCLHIPPAKWRRACERRKTNPAGNHQQCITRKLYFYNGYETFHTSVKWLFICYLAFMLRRRIQTPGSCEVTDYIPAYLLKIYIIVDLQKKHLRTSCKIKNFWKWFCFWSGMTKIGDLENSVTLQFFNFLSPWHSTNMLHYIKGIIQ